MQTRLCWDQQVTPGLSLLLTLEHVGRKSAMSLLYAHLRVSHSIRRDLIKRERYLCPNSIVVSRGCPHTCDFCYKKAFYKGGRSFYTQMVDDALAEIEKLPGRHVYF